MGRLSEECDPDYTTCVIYEPRKHTVYSKLKPAGPCLLLCPIATASLIWTKLSEGTILKMCKIVIVLFIHIFCGALTEVGSREGFLSFHRMWKTKCSSDHFMNGFELQR